MEKGKRTLVEWINDLGCEVRLGREEKEEILMEAKGGKNEDRKEILEVKFKILETYNCNFSAFVVLY